MSTERVVFKQRYRSRNKPDTKILNQKHLIYIATRPGVMKNQDCGFGLWGKLPDARAIGNINDLRHAQRVIGAASEQHTIYRAVLSVSKETAREYNLYEREEWEKLLRARIGVIRTEMHIKPENFHWVAAMHYKKNHPHVHIMYWDGGKEPKREFIDEKRFEELSASIRFAFAGKLSPPEVLEAVNGLHNEADAALKETRRQLAALLKQANLADALNLDRLKPAQCTALPLGALAMVVIGGSYYKRQTASLDKELAERRTVIERELPQFASTIRQSLNSTRDIPTILGAYRRICGPALAGEIDKTLNDMVTGNAERAIRAFETRVASPQLSQLTRGLLGVLHGDDQRVYFDLLTEDYRKLQNEIIERELLKRPEKLYPYMGALFVCLALMMIVAIGGSGAAVLKGFF